jgi:hypothetical protein
MSSSGSSWDIAKYITPTSVLDFSINYDTSSKLINYFAGGDNRLRTHSTIALELLSPS